MKKLISVAVAMLMIAISVMPAFAAISPQSTTRKYEVIVVPSDFGDPEYEFTTDIDDDGNQKVHIRPNPKPGYVFDHWEIDGDFVPVGELTDEDLELIIRGDITVVPHYIKIDTSEPATGTINVDNSGTSPKTGSNSVAPYVIVILSLAACGTVFVKLATSKKK